MVRLRQIIAYIKGEMNAMGIPVGERIAQRHLQPGHTRGHAPHPASPSWRKHHIMYSSYIGTPAVGVLRLSLFADP